MLSIINTHLHSFTERHENSLLIETYSMRSQPKNNFREMLGEIGLMESQAAHLSTLSYLGI